MSTVDHLQLIEWILAGGAGIIGTLVVAICWFYWRAIEDLRKNQDQDRADSKAADLLQAQRASVQDNRISDLNATVSGFGGQYLPRREWEVERDRIERHLEKR